jgi:hypothetical protein
MVYLDVLMLDELYMEFMFMLLFGCAMQPVSTKFLYFER